MLFEAKQEMEKAYEEWIEAKKVFENYRDGYIPYLDETKEEAEEKMEHLMVAMDFAENRYQLTRLEYESILTDEYRSLYEEVNDEQFEGGTIDELYQRAMEAKQRYDDLAQGRTPFNGSTEELKSELERLRHEMNSALDDYDDEYGKKMFEELKNRQNRAL